MITLDSVCIRNGVASTNDVVNMLANRAILLAGNNRSNAAAATTGQTQSGMGGENNDDDKLLTTKTTESNTSSQHEYHLNEVLSLLPNLQHGMDVNPKFTCGPTGVEYTNNLSAFDLLSVELVHGWLLDVQDVETKSVVETKTYNELIELVILGNEAKESGVGTLEVELREKEMKLSVMVVDDACNTAAAAGKDDGDIVEASNQIISPVEGGEGGDSEENIISTSDMNAGESSSTPTTDDTTQPEGTGGETDTSKESDKKDSNESSDPAIITVEDATQPPKTLPCTGTVKAVASIQAGGDGETDTNKASDKNEMDDESSTPPITTVADSTQQPNEPSNTKEDHAALEKEIVELKEKITNLSLQITRSEVANIFLTSSGHQLTYHGLEQLHNHVGADELCVFFRNNHFATLTKHNGVLYLLVTDLGYANTPEIVWEKLDNIDGDTEYTNEFFTKPKPRDELMPASGPTIAPELLLAQRSQAESDYQLALAMSKGAAVTPQRMDDDEGKLIEAAKELSLKAYHGDDDAVVNVEDNNDTTGNTAASHSQIDSDHDMAMAYQRQQLQSEHESEQLARQLQELEYSRQRQRPAAANQRRPVRRTAPAERPASAQSNCTIS